MRRTALLAAGVLLLTSCATAPPRPELATPYRERARILESDGQLRAALLQWKIVRTIAPDDAEARGEQARVEARIQQRVMERLGEARASLAKGAHLEARRKLLSVLALDPDNAAAAGLLRGTVREVEFVSHTVRAGETLSSLAERYYGDRSRSEVIWETNRLPPGRPLAVGSVLKIPQIPGLPFVMPGAKPPAPSTSVAMLTPATPAPSAPPAPPPAATPSRAAPPPPASEEPPEIDPMVADIRDAIDRKEYAVALADIDRYIASNPGDREVVELKKLTLYRQGYAQLEQKSYDDGYRTLRQLVRLQHDYLDAQSLVQQARRQAIDHHYQEGIRHFREERLQEAVDQWRRVIDLEPQHPNARRNIEQAERLLEALERRKTR